jgi:superfamily II DNA or RNA helicase
MEEGDQAPEGVVRTEIVGGGGLTRFSSRLGRLSHVYLKDRLAGASEYLRIAGYFRSSIFDLVNEEIESIGTVKIVCNADLNPDDIRAARHVRDQMLFAKWNEVDDTVERLLRRPRYRRLYEILKRGNVEIRVVARQDAPFLHGKAGVVRRPNGEATAFMGSLNETREGWSQNYELVWEDTSPDGVAWVEEEFWHLWNLGKPLPDAVIEEIGRSARRVEVQLEQLEATSVAPAALVESDLYRGGEKLMPWQRAFVSLFLEHRRTYGKARLLLADEVGVGKTLSLAGCALVSSLLDDGPTLILCPATLATQWQTELKDKLNMPSAVWLSSKKAWQLDPDELPLPSVGPEGIVRCPRQIGIVSTGLIVQATREAELLKKRKFGLVILDEAHRARGGAEIGAHEREPNNLLDFMTEVARVSRHVLLGTATPIQTSIEDIWDLLKVLSQDASHVLGDAFSEWRQPDAVFPVIKGEVMPQNAREAWPLFRNPIPAGSEDEVIFGEIRSALGIGRDEYVSTLPWSSVPDDGMTHDLFENEVLTRKQGLGFFQRNNPIVRHVVLRKRSRLEDAGLIPRIPVDIHPLPEQPLPAMFQGLGVRTDHDFNVAYKAAEDFTLAFARRKKGGGLLKNLMLQRLCSSYASGIATARKLLEGRTIEAGDEIGLDLEAEDLGLVAEERRHLEAIIGALGDRPADPKLKAVLHFLQERRWIGLGCIVFSQYYETALWTAERLAVMLGEATPIAIYAGVGKSKLWSFGQWQSVERNHIKKAVADGDIKLVVATDAACEGLNLQALGTLINIDLPWNPSRLEQRIGRIKRFGQRRDRVDMLNLVYHGDIDRGSEVEDTTTIDEKIYARLSERMRTRFDIFGTLPDVINDEWITNIENLDEKLKEFTIRRARANAFDLRYAADVDASDERWELCERVLARADVVERLSRGWNERAKASAMENQG